jgi:hypothetical protein
LDRDIAMAEGDVRALTYKLIRLQARAARLQATINNDSEVRFPDEILKMKDAPAVATITADENATFVLDQKTVAQEAQALDTIRGLYKQEILSLRGQVGALKKEQDTIQRQLQELRVLANKGLGLAPSLVALERAMSQLSNEQLNIGTAIVRSEQGIATAEQKLPELDLSRRRSNIRALADTRDEMKDVQSRLTTARDLLSEARITAPREARANEARLLEEGNSSGTPILVMRREGDKMREIVAEETTIIEPEDVIKVPRSNGRP